MEREPGLQAVAPDVLRGGTPPPAALLAGASVTADVNEKSLRYRIATVLPGRGYRKLISRLVASQQEYFAIDRAMRNVWYGEGGPGGR